MDIADLSLRSVDFFPDISSAPLGALMLLSLEKQTIGMRALFMPIVGSPAPGFVVLTGDKVGLFMPEAELDYRVAIDASESFVITLQSPSPATVTANEVSTGDLCLGRIRSRPRLAISCTVGSSPMGYLMLEGDRKGYIFPDPTIYGKLGRAGVARLDQRLPCQLCCPHGLPAPGHDSP